MQIIKCNYCQIEGPLEQFTKRADCKYGRAKTCKNCESIKSIAQKRGLSFKEYKDLRETHSGLCDICGLPESAVSSRNYKKIQSLSLDHCHKTNTIRGFLCTTCNVGLGSFKDNLKLLQKAIKYLANLKSEE